MILQTEREAVVSVLVFILDQLLYTLSQHSLDVPGFGPGHVSGLLQAHPEAVEGSKRCPCAPKQNELVSRPKSIPKGHAKSGNTHLSPVMQDPPMVKKASSKRPLVLLAPVGRMNSSVS